MTKLISCDLHDHFEIVCMRRSQVQVTLADGNKQTGQALDIVLENGKEWLKLQTDSELLSINLLDINCLAAINNPIAAHNFVVELN
ncbi:hypothetical protein C2869_04975 [Saccharobesus litoralis]|uniref:Rho-binding antiterminator n=1 Tax=Saccharobesus litoralis TaxID=2172099 RepID=A0A2S0VNR8_9ALTE|nr:Rho-binding antiterminator [Saccharobesus litoralis]AWB65832.1 hypothetical protein C2869_04975 [Saccharobesus litoralis]